ncbi:MAG TPA: protease inhibitor I42 family protein [Vicinamibacterales bacterium]|nr:protease inhibitor I42 family protein [Vicinamibacterales bacterium]
MPDLNLTESQHGGSFTVSAGDLIVITLPENPTTGYRWSAGSLDASLLSQEGHDYRQGGPGVGSGGTVVWRFRAKGEGRARIELKKARSWEAGAEPAGQFAVSIDIKR